MLPAEVKKRIEDGLTECSAFVNEFSGGTDHYSVIVVTKDFDGLPLIKRHRLVMDLFAPEFVTGEVHALTIKAFTPTQWETEKPSLIKG